jgi:hypothetical protein
MAFANGVSILHVRDGRQTTRFSTTATHDFSAHLFHYFRTGAASPLPQILSKKS